MLDRLRPAATGLDCIPAWFLRLGLQSLQHPALNYTTDPYRLPSCHDNGKQQELCPCRKLRNLQFSRANSAQSRSHQSCPDFSKGTSSRPTSTRHSISRHQVSVSPSLPSGQLARPQRRLLPFRTQSVWNCLPTRMFDTVRHATLMEKVAQLPIPDQVYNWIKDFFQGHSHCTKFAGSISELADIIQGSAI